MRALPLFSFVLAVLLASACRTPAEHTHSPLAACHPACPGARQGELADTGAILRGDAPPAAATAPAAEHAPSAAAYLCPMHPWIGADQPGRCVQCNMQLVERARVLEQPRGE